MGRKSNYPTTVEDCTIISCKNLKDWGYLASNNYSYQSGSITSQRGGCKSGSLGIVVCNTASSSYIEFNYSIISNYEEKEPIKIKYRVPLVKVATNIGDSYRFYFLCPNTSKRCSKLYKPPHEHYFLHRAAFPYLFYQNQLESKFQKFIYNHSTITLEVQIDNLYDELQQKYKKTHYRGRPTKLMQKYLYLCSQYESIDNSILSKSL